MKFWNFSHIAVKKTQKSFVQNQVAYRRLAKLYHPDIYKGQDKDRFKLIQEAHEVLKLPEKRREYDSLNSIFQNQHQEDVETTNQNQDLYNFQYKSQEFDEIKIKEDFQKFMSQKIKVQPQSIKVVDDPVLKQFSQEERLRHDYVQFRQDPTQIYQKQHQLSFSSITNENIDSINEDFKQNQPEFINIYIKKEQKKRNIIRKIILLLFITSLPFYYSLLIQKKIFKEKLDKGSKQILDQMDQEELNELHDRIIFNKKNSIL